MMRQWQQAAMQQMFASSENRFFLEATPASGKTYFAVCAAKKMIRDSRADHVVIVSPTDVIRRQWVDECENNDLTCTSLLSYENWPCDANVLSLSYQQIRLYANELREVTVGRRVAFIFDEIHHCGDNSSWGDAIVLASECAVYWLSLSGTAFRSDKCKIPFLNYNRLNESVPDFEYTYQQGLKDRVCRRVLFTCFGGEVEWIDRNGQSHTHKMSDKLSLELQSQRLRTSLTVGSWLNQVILEANKRLTQYRQRDASAAGLVVAMDKRHALQVAESIRRIVGIEPLVVTEDNPVAAQQIRDFAKGSERWIVAVKMVSEGVDIRRLRVGVYATNIRRELTFRQIVGRFVRMQQDQPSQTAMLYYPEDPYLKLFVSGIEKTVSHDVTSRTQKDSELNESDLEDDTKDLDRYRERFIPVDSVGQIGITQFSEVKMSQHEMRRVEAYIEDELGGIGDVATLASVWKKEGRLRIDPHPENETAVVLSVDQKKEHLRRKTMEVIRRQAGKTGRVIATVAEHIKDKSKIDDLSGASLKDLETRHELAATYPSWMPKLSILSQRSKRTRAAEYAD